jgi:hypothetical protein
MVSEKVYGKEKKAEVVPIIMSSDDSDIEEIEIDNNLLEQPFQVASSTSTFRLLYDTSASPSSDIMIPRATSTLDPTAFSVIATDGSGTSSLSAPDLEVLPTIPTPPLIASPLQKNAAFTSFDERLANPYGLGRKYTF